MDGLDMMDESRDGDGVWLGALEIIRRLQDRGYQAFLVGGGVRNRLLGLPAKDYDIATSAPPDVVAALFSRSDLVGAHFCVVLVLLGGHAYEVATFRRDGRYVDHRRPQSVSFGSLQQDALRRDFTINALYYDPVADQLIDLVGGRDDLNAGRLRCIGDPDQRFEEDALRLLRAVRFACRFQLTIEPAAWRAMQARHGLVATISAERVRDELIGIFTGPHRGRALDMLAHSGLLSVLLPEVEATRGVAQPPQFHPEGDVFTHTCLTLDALEDFPTPALALAALLHDIGKPPTFRQGADRIRFDGHDRVGAEMADAVARRLRLPNRMRERIVALIRRHMAFINIGRMKPSTLRRFLAAPTIDEDLALHRADVLSTGRSPEYWEFCVETLARLRCESATILPPPLINGDDLIALGMPPGPAFGKMLRQVADLQMEGAVTTREQALNWARENFGADPRTS